MKAKEVVKKFKECIENTDTFGAQSLLVDYINELHQNIFDLFNARNPTRGQAMLSIFKEVEQRWLSVCSKVDNFIIDETRFSSVLLDRFPDTYNFWKALEESTGHTTEKYELGKKAGLLKF